MDRREAVSVSLAIVKNAISQEQGGKSMKSKDVEQGLRKCAINGRF